MTKEEFLQKKAALNALYAKAQTDIDKYYITREQVKLQEEWRATARPEDKVYLTWEGENGSVYDMEILPC